MWRIGDIKEKAKLAMNKNYWAMVLVSLLVLVSGISVSTFTVFKDDPIRTQYISWVTSVDNNDTEQPSDELKEDYIYYNLPDDEENAGLSVDPMQMIEKLGNNDINGAIVAICVYLFFFLIWALILLPLEVGCKRWFVLSRKEKTQFSEILYPFKKNYFNVVKVMVCVRVIQFLYALLLIIPGIYKMYEYRMVPYLLAQDSSTSREDAFTKSNIIMNGNKKDALLFDLSFIGWYILAAVTLNIMGILFLNPYKNAADAALFEILYGQYMNVFHSSKNEDEGNEATETIDEDDDTFFGDKEYLAEVDRALKKVWRIAVIQFAIIVVIAASIVGGYKLNVKMKHDSIYNSVKTCLQDGRNKDAYSEYVKIKGYKDIDSIIAPYLIKTEGAEFKWGFIDDEDDNEHTKWIVLKVDGDRTLIISKDYCDYGGYNSVFEEDEDGELIIKKVTWETSYTREWLNNEYIDAQFTPEQQERILLTNVENKDNSIYGTDGGNDTQDKIFLLSEEEVMEYFESNEESTVYDRDSHAYSYEWWLRTPGKDRASVCYVYGCGPEDWAYTDEKGPIGAIDKEGKEADEYCAVLPAMWVDNNGFMPD